MAATIGGKVKLDGEAEYRSAIKNINSEVKTLQSEMKAAASSFDENATAEEKAQKSAGLLADAMEQQQKKIDLVSERLSMANDAYGEGSAQSQKYRKELADAETVMGSMKDQAKKLEGGVDDVAEAEDDATEKTSTFGDTLKANLTADAITNGLSAIKDGIVDIANSSVDAWHDVDDGMDTIVTKTGASGDALADMQQRAKDIATSIPTDFEAAGTAIGEVNTRFGLTGDALSELSQQFIEFAEINGTDVNSSIDAVQTALSAFGLSADDAGAMLDALNVAGQNSGVSLDKLEANLTSNATAFQSMGFSAQDSINLLSTLEKSGIDTSVVLTGLSKVQVNAAKDGVSMQDEFTKAISSSEGAIDVFGSKAGPKLYEAFQNGTLSVEDFTAANADLNDSLGSVQETYDATLDPLDQVTVAQNKLKELQAELVDAIMPALLPLIEKAGDYISQIDISAVTEKIEGIDFDKLVDRLTKVADALMDGVNFLLDHGDTVVAVIAGIGTAIAAVKIGGVISSLASVVPALGGVAAALGPVGLAIGAAVGVGTLLYQNWDTIKEKAGELKDHVVEKFNTLKDSVTETWGNIKDGISEKVDSVKEKIGDAWENIKTGTAEAWDNIKSGISEKWEDLKSGASETFDNIRSGIGDAWENIKTGTAETWDNIKSGISEKWEDLKSGASETFDNIKTGISDAWENIKAGASDTWESVTGTLSDKWNDIKSKASETFENVKSGIGDAWENIKQNTSDTWENVRSGLSEKWEDVKSKASETFENVKSNISDAWANIKQDTADKWDSIKQKVDENGGGIQGVIKTYTDDYKQKWQEAFNTINDATGGKLGDALSTVQSKMADIKQAFSDKLEDAKSIVSGAIEKIKGFFNFSWSLPSLKLPHISIVGEFSLTPPSVPHFSIDWYAKAMNDGMILNKPTIFGVSGNRFLAGGENGPEVVVGASSLERMIGEAVSQANNSICINVYAAEGQDVNELAQIVSDKIDANIRRQQRAFA